MKVWTLSILILLILGSNAVTAEISVAAGTPAANGRYAVRSEFWTNMLPPVVPSKICYTSGGDIWKMDPDGSNRQLVIDAGTNDIEPAWSPDGTKIAFKSDRSPSPNGGIWVVNSNGTGLVLLTNTPGAGNAKPTWSPDGSKIAFHSNRDGLISSIYIMNADGSNVTRLTNQLPFSDAGAEWSPDGTRMVFETNQNLGSNIGIVNLDGSGRAVIGAGQFPAWSPDGTKIIFALLTASGYHIYTMNPAGGDITQLTFGVPNDQYPSFSPDGQRIVFARNTSGIIGLWTMNADGTNQLIFAGTNTIGNGYSDWQRSLNTPVGAPVTVQIDDAMVTFAIVSVEGNTTIAPITPNPAQIPPGFAACSGCPTYDIVTTATYSQPVAVCLLVPSVTTNADFNKLHLFHDEGGVLIDRTSSRDFAGRRICAETTSLSPFVVLQDLGPTAAPAFVAGRVSTSDGRGVSNARVLMSSQGGVERVARANSFGHFRFESVPSGRSYLISVQHNRFQFEPRIILVLGNITDADFVAIEETH